MRNEIKVEARIAVTPLMLAEGFCAMNDEDQAQFFIEAARISRSWRQASSSMQWFYVGRHLRDCSCSTFEARLMVEEISNAANHI